MALIIVPLTWRELNKPKCGQEDELAPALGYIAFAFGRCCGINLCLLLISVGRSSGWLQKFSSSYTEAVSIHRIAGWWCVAHVVLHSLGFVMFYWAEGGWRNVLQRLLPLDIEGALNKQGMLNFYGALGMLSSLILAAFALQPVRRRMYGMFYSTHTVSAALFILFGSLHDFSVLLYTLPACSYVIERAYAKYMRTPFIARLEALSPTLAKLSVSLSARSDLTPGTRWLHIKVPCMSREWHPYSITGHAHETVLHIKAVGDWSRRLCSLAGTTNEIKVLVDGPYGVAERSRHVCRNFWSCPFSSSCSDLASRPLLLVAGGVGIVPFADLLDSQARSWSNAIVIWAVRSESEYEVLEQSLCIKSKASGRIQVQVYITKPSSDSPFASCKPQTDLMQVDSHSHVKSRIGLALQSQLVTGTLPAIVLFLTVHMQGLIANMSQRPSWNVNIFQWSLATQASVFMLAYLAVGLLALAFALLLSSVGIAHDRRPEAREEPVQLAEPLQAEPYEETPFLMRTGRPDIKAIVSHLAEEGTLSCRACGPKCMLDAVCAAVSSASALGKKVSLHIEQAEW